jgi:DNA polymerase III alpha subunit (gram-positive type)
LFGVAHNAAFDMRFLQLKKQEQADLAFDNPMLYTCCS